MSQVESNSLIDIVEDHPGSNPLRVFEKVGHLARRLHQISTSVFIDEAKAYNLTPVQFSVLMAVKIFPGIDQVGVGKIVALDRTTVSIVVKRLIERGLVARRQAKGRKAPLFMTGAAAAVIEVMRPRLENIEQIILSPLTEDERTNFMRLLMKLVDMNNSLSRAPHGTKDTKSAPKARPEVASVGRS